ncbi:S1 family peptidase [Hyalangium versicolor]|uniref:S1 family peptidase n=1 Tax=Hyalangium versicolor TaxID=2861190 RepID=UPI001CCDFAAD|nr:trypsin-like serine protease [Hyalangium versicolor]
MGTTLRQLARFALCLSIPVLSSCSAPSQALQYEKEMVVGITGGVSCGTAPGLEAVGALVRRDHKVFCSATLIAEDTVLTAAHCIEDEDLAELSFRMGEEPTAPYFPVASASPHPRYAKSKLGSYDLAVLHLRAPVPGVTPLPYRKASLPVYFRGRLTFVGFGDADGVAKTGAGIKRCLRLYISRVNDFTFENNTLGHDTCHGDSGGPVLDYKDGKWEIVGVIAAGDGQCRRFGLSARVDVASEWIARTASPQQAAAGLNSSEPAADADGGRLHPLEVALEFVTIK